MKEGPSRPAVRCRSQATQEQEALFSFARDKIRRADYDRQEVEVALDFLAEKLFPLGALVTVGKYMVAEALDERLLG